MKKVLLSFAVVALMASCGGEAAHVDAAHDVTPTPEVVVEPTPEVVVDTVAAVDSTVATDSTAVAVAVDSTVVEEVAPAAH